MTSQILERRDAAAAASLPPRRQGVGARVRRALPGRGLGIGLVTLWLSVIVLLPLAALTVASFDEGLAGFWDAVTAPSAVATLQLTVGVSAVVALVNAVMGTLVAWVLVRDDFPGKRVVNALIDLPFALPTIVASIVLLSLYGPNSPIGLQLNATRWGLIVALAFVTLPFVVRSVQPVLIEADREVEEAAASLGASNWVTFRRVVLPTLAPAIWGGAGLAFARAIGEYGSVVLIGGNIPRETQVASQYIQQQIEIDRPVNAAAVSVALLAIAFATLLVLRLLAGRSLRREEAAP
jgi:sulfate transport system permease protein